MLSLQIQPTTANRPRRARSGDAYARRKSAVANEAHSYHPSLVNRIVAISSIDGTVNYTYGIGGNSAPELLRTADYSNAAIPDEVYNHDQNYNRILDSEHGAGFVYGPGNRLVSDGIYNYQYDHEGNMTRRTEIATGDYRVFDYDERNRLVALSDYDFAGAALMTEQMSYDAFDRRISLQVDTAPGDGVEAAVTHFGYDGEDVIVDAVDPDGASGPAAAAVETTYLHGAGIDEVLAQEKAGMGTQWLLTDHLGSTRDIVDNSGSVLNHIVFASFGGIVSQSNAAFSSRYLYTQREFDAASGLNYYRARYYDTGLGRFLSEDPIGFKGSMNFFAYAESNPIVFKDPSGLASIDSLNASVEQAIATNNVKFIQETLKFARQQARDINARLRPDLDRLAVESIIRLKNAAAAGAACGTGITNASQILGKVENYLLSDPGKADFFFKNLGITKQNSAFLANQIAFDANTAIPTKITQYGQGFNQVQSILGTNGNIVSINFAWQLDAGTNNIRLITATFP